MAKFNLNNYDEVKDRITQFYKDNPDGRIITDVIYQDGERTMIKAYVYLDRGDHELGLPKATGIAEEVRIMEKSISKKTGEEYEEVNYSSWTENCETSAIGRALANMDMSGDKRPSRQEMEKVQRYSKASSLGGKKFATEKQKNYLDTLISRTGQLPDQWYESKGLNREQLSTIDASKFIEELK